ncbi:flagellar biosynthesis anti-sigma factor FlgM [Pseudothermotoga thermarum]|uniref:Anti-sigma-28 factor FlgM family protein n=1 Tax=Pseudothermotoga thermarum DSM 5069 TaxID=688269 RepID=F7YX77_9THEM|nr:flagellar biosynthesis anti-sigma factor FlgM [Pseudothermotoga thermarum]AEH51142.1 Anti-sigma-28 factor FlgM family protein [Pseudothermotoga thermarum DSM 5069]
MTEINRIEGPVPPQQPKAPQISRKRENTLEGSAFVKSESLNIIELVKMAKESPEVRQKLVDQIRQAIEANVYNVDPERIARRILSEL